MGSQPAPAAERKSLVGLIVSELSVLALAAAVLLSPLTPSLDGYSHLYGAKMLGWMLSGQAQAHRYFVYNTALLPNWLADLSLAGLAAVFPAELALKLLVLLTIAVLAGALWFAAGRHTALLPVMLAFAVNNYITQGFHGFVLGTALCFWVLGILLRHGMSLPPRLQIVAAVLLIACYYSNPLPSILSLTLPFAWLLSAIAAKEETPRILLRRFFRNIWPWIPLVILLPWFYLRLSSQPEVSADNPALTFRFVHRVSELLRDGLTGISPTGTEKTLFMLLTGFLLAGALWRGKPAGAAERTRTILLAALAAASLVLFLLVPDSVGEAAYLSHRFLLYAVLFLAILGGAATVLNRTLLNASSVLGGLVVLIFCGEYVVVARGMAPALDELKAAVAAIPEHSTVLVLGYRRSPSCDEPPVLADSVPERHWAMSAMIQNRLIVLDNYEAQSAVFPLRYRRSVDVRNEFDLADAKDKARWAETLQGANGAAYVVVWGVSGSGVVSCAHEVSPPLQNELMSRYRLVDAKEGRSEIQIWKDRGSS